MTVETTTPMPTLPRPEAALQAPSHELKPVYRDAVLQDLLGVDYEYAQGSGLIDQFYFDPETGEDGLLHTLGGDIVIGLGGANLPQGYHHEPSARDERTYVDRDHLAGANKDHRKLYREFPYEPYAAQVVVDGLNKMSVKTDENGESTLVPAHSNMFPKEYDALTVMKAIVQARDSRDKAEDRPEPGTDLIIAEGYAPLLDDQSNMKLRIVLDKDTDKVVSAYPAERKKSGYMALDKTAVREHLGL